MLRGFRGCQGDPRLLRVLVIAGTERNLETFKDVDSLKFQLPLGLKNLLGGFRWLKFFVGCF